MKYLFGTIVIILVALSFIGPQCDHVFTQVEEPIIKIERFEVWQSGVYTMPPTGIHEGKELICVKCFLKQKQKLDYGQPEHGQTLTELLSGIDSCLFVSGGILKVDTCGAIRLK